MYEAMANGWHVVDRLGGQGAKIDGVWCVFGRRTRWSRVGCAICRQVDVTGVIFPEPLEPKGHLLMAVELKGLVPSTTTSGSVPSGGAKVFRNLSTRSMEESPSQTPLFCNDISYASELQ